MSAYWRQWESYDLDSWQGKDIDLSDCDDEFEEEKEQESEEERCYRTGDYMSLYGLSPRDFL